MEKANSKQKRMEFKNTHVYLNDKHLRQIPKDIDNNTLVLYLHNNILLKLENVSKLYRLTHLYLQWNKIRKIENLDGLYNLKKLYLGNNMISVLENLQNLPNLIELHVEKQLLDCGETMCFDPRCMKGLGETLQVLNISDNKLTNVAGIDCLNYLSTLYAKNNMLCKYDDLLATIKPLIFLRELDLRGNPMCKIPRYREKIIAVCFKLDNLDGKIIMNSTRLFLKCFESKRNEVKDLKLCRVEKHETDSPDSQLALLEAQRAAKTQMLQDRKRIKEMSGGIPRCFWRNKTSSKHPKLPEDNKSATFDNFLKSTSSDEKKYETNK